MRGALALLVDGSSGATTSEEGFSGRIGRGLDGELRVAFRVLVLGVGIVGVWATFVPLSGAVVLPGTLVVESNVKKLQHPTGGVVAEIAARDGMHVDAGDLVLRLDETQIRANRQVLANQLDQIRVRLARLVAERDGMTELKVPRELSARMRDATIEPLVASERSLLDARAQSRRAQKDLLRSTIGQLEDQIAGLQAQLQSKSSQLELISSELIGVNEMYSKGLAPLTRLTTLKREAARLEGEQGQLTSAVAETKAKIGQGQLQIMKVDQDLQTEVMKDLREAEDKEAELVEKIVAAQDQLNRVEIRAPTSGVVHQLSVHTIGGVIRPSDVVMEIVPESDALAIEARLTPHDIDQVRRGQTAYLRFSAFNQRTTPQLAGVVSYVSADLSRDAQTNSTYYTVRITLSGEERRRLGDLTLIAGMPVDAFLQTGSRTMMSYLLKPLSDQFQRMFIER
jgi:HlyD family secretion protein